MALFLSGDSVAGFESVIISIDADIVAVVAGNYGIFIGAPLRCRDGYRKESNNGYDLKTKLDFSHPHMLQIKASLTTFILIASSRTYCTIPPVHLGLYTFDESVLRWCCYASPTAEEMQYFYYYLIAHPSHFRYI